MRIVSDFHDYYDSAMAFGADPNVVYERRTRDVVIPVQVRETWDRLPGSGRYAHGGDPLMVPILVVVAGTVHLGYGLGTRRDAPFDRWIWGLESAMQARDKAFGKPQTNRAEDMFRKGYRLNDAGLRAAFGMVDALDWTDLCIETRTPLFLVHGHDGGIVDGYRRFEVVMKANPMLRDFGFASTVDPYSLFQSIDQFQGGVLPHAGADMAVIGDRLRSEKHGFDKWSFRRHKEDPR